MLPTVDFGGKILEDTLSEICPAARNPLGPPWVLLAISRKAKLRRCFLDNLVGGQDLIVGFVINVKGWRPECVRGWIWAQDYHLEPRHIWLGFWENQVSVKCKIK